MELPPTEGRRWACGPAKAARWPEAPGATEPGPLEPFCICGVRALGTQAGLGDWGGGCGVLCKVCGGDRQGKNQPGDLPSSKDQNSSFVLVFGKCLFPNSL